jgi:hypothetical protein
LRAKAALPYRRHHPPIDITCTMTAKPRAKSKTRSSTHPEAAPQGAPLPLPPPLPLLPAPANWGWMLELGISTTRFALALLQAQRTALQGVDPLAPAGAQLTIGDVYQLVAAAGYRAISEIEWEDDHYEVEAQDSDGREVELRVDGHSGAIDTLQPDD